VGLAASKRWRGNRAATCIQRGTCTARSRSPEAEATKQAERAGTGIEHAKQMVIARYTLEQLSQMRRMLYQ
jgi:hypothetical protein